MKIDRPVVITPTRVESAAACERKHQINDLLEMGKEKNVAAAFGNVLHAGHGALWQAREIEGKAEQAYDLGVQALERDWLQQELEGRAEKYTLAKAKTMFDAYVAQARRVGPFTEAGDWKILTVEDRIRVNIGEYILSMQIDRSFQQFREGKLVVVDLKTVTRPDAKWKAKWYRSIQMKLYSFGAKQTYGFDDVEFVIEGLDKNAKPKVHEVMLPQWSDALLNEAVETFKRHAERDRLLIERAIDKTTGDVNLEALEEDILNNSNYNYENCEAYGSTCAYAPLCNAEPDQRRALLHAEYKPIPADY